MARRVAGAARWLVHDSRNLLSLPSPTFFGGFLQASEALGDAVVGRARGVLEPVLEPVVCRRPCQSAHASHLKTKRTGHRFLTLLPAPACLCLHLGATGYQCCCQLPAKQWLPQRTTSTKTHTTHCTATAGRGSPLGLPALALAWDRQNHLRHLTRPPILFFPLPHTLFSFQAAQTNPQSCWLVNFISFPLLHPLLFSLF